MTFQLLIEQLKNTMGVGYFVLLYAVGVLAMVLSVIAYQFRYRTVIIVSTLFGQLCWVAHFLLQGDVTSAIACALTAIMLAAFTKRNEWTWVKSPFCVIFFVIVICGFSILSFATWSDVFPVLAGAFAVIANSRPDEKSLRQYSVLFCLFWLLNSIFKLYPLAFVNDLFCLVSAILSLVRYRDPKKNENNKDEGSSGDAVLDL